LGRDHLRRVEGQEEVFSSLPEKGKRNVKRGGLSSTSRKTKGMKTG